MDLPPRVVGRTRRKEERRVEEDGREKENGRCEVVYASLFVLVE